jgi:DNA-binding PadR family transcriptional regulator
VYPALHRMEEGGWIKARKVTTEHNRRARAYEITSAGRGHLGIPATYSDVLAHLASSISVLSMRGLQSVKRRPFRSATRWHTLRWMVDRGWWMVGNHESPHRIA